MGGSTRDGFETLVVGGGPAGLSAAIYLARFNRRVALFDVGQGRSTWQQINHNYLGFPGGIAARELRERGRQQLAEYEHVTCFEHKIDQLRRDGAGFVAAGQAGAWRAATVILCTGVIDHFPHFDGWEEYAGRGMFWCVTCDGYASRNKQVVVLGNTNETAVEALQLGRFTDRLSLLTNSATYEIDHRFEERLHRAGIEVIHDKLEQVHGRDGMPQSLVTRGGRELELDHLFAVQGATPQTELAARLGVARTDAGYIEVDTEQRTSLPGLFAAGDVTRLHSHQISTAVHEGGQAASAANYFLYPPDLRED